MQKIFFLCFVVGLLGCQNPKKAKVNPELFLPVYNYRQLPERYQQKLDFLDLLLNPATQKDKFEQALVMAKGRQKFDSLYLIFLGKPFDAFKESIYQQFSEVETDSPQVLIIHSSSWTTTVDAYYLGSDFYSFKKVKVDAGCNPITGSKPLSETCFELLEQKDQPSSLKLYRELIDYLDKCGFYHFTTNFKSSCMDGDSVTVWVKYHQEYMVVSAHCPSELHPLRIILDKAIKWMDTDRVK